ncbi:MAG: urea carboxylase-associated protein [Candidatus Eremiobacter antarcticus]|nr:urea carboxylase-associated family protein [Candidatus Eremiobacteraeota bacterium]MBC5809036.1 urea carboxylase-associated family protein [Candidatus Eremiobacteraeota bacterium]PZR64271.1 MAG: urea carboxylase-associated protein [Candidatus Eremiobacter sp. RRmetagenome_bin22]
MQRLQPQTGCAFTLIDGQALEICDPEGCQVADVAAFSQRDVRESFSSGRTLDYNELVYLTTGAALYSNRSSQMLKIESDDVKRHDYLLTPCSSRMFELLRGEFDHPSCLTNLANSLRPFGIAEDDVRCTFNAFMNVSVSDSGRVTVSEPRSAAGDKIVLRAHMDLIVALTACSSEHSNGGRCKAIEFRILGPVG